MSRVVVVFGQYGAAADLVNLPNFRLRLANVGFGTILVQHYDSRAAYEFLKDYDGFRGLVGASLGAMSAVVFAGYLAPTPVHFVGMFQPSDWDPSGHTVNIQDGPDLITRAITVPATVRECLCFRNPLVGATGGLGHATAIAADPQKTKLTIINKLDTHPGDFGDAADTMFNKIMELAA